MKEVLNLADTDPTLGSHPLQWGSILSSGCEPSGARTGIPEGDPGCPTRRPFQFGHSVVLAAGLAEGGTSHTP